MIRSGDKMFIAIVPAKLRSKRLPDKNWKEFMHGESLAEKKFLQAIGCGYFNYTVLSVDFLPDRTDFLKKEKNKYALTHSQGWEIRRRPRLLGDSSVDVVIDALDSVKAQPEDIYCLLQPTSPFLTKETIWKALETVETGDCKVVSTNPAYKPNGAIYAGKVVYLYGSKDFYRPRMIPLVMDWVESIDVDYDYDFEIARCLRE